MSLLEQRIPFALARFNDGEMGGIMQPGWPAARGDQPVNHDLSRYLLDAFSHEQLNYWKGIPCSLCYPRLREAADAVLGRLTREYAHICAATVLTNSNWKRAIEDIPKALKGRHVTWVSGDDQDIEKLDFEVAEFHQYQRKNTWENVNEIFKLVDTFPQDDVVMISLGPTARVLTKMWYKIRPDMTVIDIGSTFDPMTRDVWHRCHHGTLPRCNECNLI